MPPTGPSPPKECEAFPLQATYVTYALKSHSKPWCPGNWPNPTRTDEETGTGLAGICPRSQSTLGRGEIQPQPHHWQRNFHHRRNQNPGTNSGFSIIKQGHDGNLLQSWRNFLSDTKCLLCVRVAPDTKDPAINQMARAHPPGADTLVQLKGAVMDTQGKEGAPGIWRSSVRQWEWHVQRPCSRNLLVGVLMGHLEASGAEVE